MFLNRCWHFYSINHTRFGGRCGPTIVISFHLVHRDFKTKALKKGKTVNRDWVCSTSSFFCLYNLLLKKNSTRGNFFCFATGVKYHQGNHRIKIILFFWSHTWARKRPPNPKKKSQKLINSVGKGLGIVLCLLGSTTKFLGGTSKTPNLWLFVGVCVCVFIFIFVMFVCFLVSFFCLCVLSTERVPGASQPVEFPGAGQV